MSWVQRFYAPPLSSLGGIVLGSPMAIVTEKDGKETTGGIAAIRDAFQAASDGKLVCLDARMSYGAGDVQNLRFIGRWAVDGTPFDVSDMLPAGAPLAPHARAMARELIEGKTASDPTEGKVS